MSRYSRNSRIADRFPEQNIEVRDFRERIDRLPLREDYIVEREFSPHYTLADSFEYEERMAWLIIILFAVLIFWGLSK